MEWLRNEDTSVQVGAAANLNIAPACHGELEPARELLSSIVDAGTESNQLITVLIEALMPQRASAVGDLIRIAANRSAS